MDWMRRNWPDLLIGLALLLVIGGIIATLLNGGNILPLGGSASNQPATVSTQTTTEPTTQPVTPTEANGGSSATTATATTTEGAPTNTTDTGVAAVDPNAVTMPDNQGGTGTITAVPPTLDGAADSATDAVEAVASDITDTTTDTATADTATPTTDVAVGSPTAPYRISVGAFGSAENAERRAQAFEEAGYPVFTANQGDLVLVLVGPYSSQAEAEGVKAELQSSGLEANPIVYEFTSDDAATTPSSDTSVTDTDTAQPDTAQPDASPSEATTTSTPSTSTSGRYLQVGAYNSLESAAPQRTTLEGLGFSVSTVEENDFVKLLVGPFDDVGISTAQSQLSAQGIESFVR